MLKNIQELRKNKLIIYSQTYIINKNWDLEFLIIRLKADLLSTVKSALLVSFVYSSNLLPIPEVSIHTVGFIY